MTNADKFKETFNMYATEIWVMIEEDFLKWLNADYKNESQIKDGEDYLCGYQDKYNAKGVLNQAGVEIHIDKPRGYTLKTDTNDAWKSKGEQQGDILLLLHHTGFIPQIKPIKQIERSK